MAENKAILLVEDDAHISYIIEFILKKQGFEVHKAEDGKQAGLLINEIAPPAAVILDIMLPFKNGFEILKDIRQKQSWNHVPILVLTAKSKEDAIHQALQDGATTYLVKPFDPSLLIARIRQITTP